jgi:CubicO group peptidase (beta-lactamase class C family)
MSAAADATGWSRIPRAHAVLERGRRDGLHIGAQLYVSRSGVVVADCALGESRRGVPMTPDTLMIWFSSTKPVTAVALAQQWERGRCRPDDPVYLHVPEFAAGGKSSVTIRHLLTHTGGFRFADGFGTRRGPFAASWEENVARVCAADLETGWEPGQRAGYHPTSSMFIVGEIVRRCDGRAFDRYVREEIFLPLGMCDCWIGMPPEQFRAYGERIGLMHNTEKEEIKPLPITDSEEGTAFPAVTGAGRARARMVLQSAARRRPATARASWPADGRRARPAIRWVVRCDGRLVVDWGLGFAIDTVRTALRTDVRPWGAQSSVGFADPEHGVVVAW